MVYEEDTKELCHDLSESGKEAYQEMMAREADKMLVDNQHKVLAFFAWLFSILGFTDTFIQRRYLKLLDEMKQSRM